MRESGRGRKFLRRAEADLGSDGRGSGYLGQGPPEIRTGLGDEGAADVLRLFWSPSAVQDAIQVPAGKHAVIAEAPNGESGR